MYVSSTSLNNDDRVDVTLDRDRRVERLLLLSQDLHQGLRDLVSTDDQTTYLVQPFRVSDYMKKPVSV